MRRITGIFYSQRTRNAASTEGRRICPDPFFKLSYVLVSFSKFIMKIYFENLLNSMITRSVHLYKVTSFCSICACFINLITGLACQGDSNGECCKHFYASAKQGQIPDVTSFHVISSSSSIDDLKRVKWLLAILFFFPLRYLWKNASHVVFFFPWGFYEKNARCR